MAVLSDQDRYGYGISSEVRDLSDGRVRLGTGSLERLQEFGYVVATREEVVDGRLRRYYSLTGDGRTALGEELASRESLITAARHRLAGSHG